MSDDLLVYNCQLHHRWNVTFYLVLVDFQQLLEGNIAVSFIISSKQSPHGWVVA